MPSNVLMLTKQFMHGVHQHGVLMKTALSCMNKALETVMKAMHHPTNHAWLEF